MNNSSLLTFKINGKEVRETNEIMEKSNVADVKDLTCGFSWRKTAWY